MVTEIVVSTVVALTTTTDVQMLTTTVTDVQTYTTFGISTTTTVNFLTTTTTIMSTVAMTVQPECTEAKIVYCLLFTSYQSISVQYFPLSVFKLTLFENGHIVCMPALTCWNWMCQAERAAVIIYATQRIRSSDYILLTAEVWEVRKMKTTKWR